MATDTSGIMHALRTLVVSAMALALLATASPTLAQPSATETDPPLPLARQPDGHLPLEGTPWRLEGYRHGGREGVPGPEVAAVIVFTAGVFEASGGCAKVRGGYGVNGAALSLQPKTLNERACTEHLALVQQAVENGLRQAGSYTVEAGPTWADDKLVIRSVAGVESLRYGLDDLALLDAAEWRLESYTADGRVIPASVDMPALLSFRPETNAVARRQQTGPLLGSSGCNGIVAEFYRHADVLSLGPLEITDAPCSAELAAQEAALVALLDATAIWLDLPYERLVLTSADTGERLDFVSQVPLEGTTWWPEGVGIDGAGSLVERGVTLRLEDGRASGEGPCGPYEAAYVTDGAFITFTDVRGARDPDCPESRVERALVGALRRSVVVRRTAERVRFEDAQGRTTLTLSRPFAP